MSRQLTADMKTRSLAEIAREAEAHVVGGEYESSERELARIDRGLRAADERRFASDQQVDAALNELRNA
jgi:predicted transcriptional regulator